MIKWILAWRYFLKRPISYLAVVAVMLCVFIVVVVMTVMNGLLGDYRQKNHAFAGDCVVDSDSLVGFGYYEEFLQTLNEQPEIAAASPVARGIGVLSIRQLSQGETGVELYGIDPVLHSRATAFAETLHYTDDVSSVFTAASDPQKDLCIPGVYVIHGRSQSDGGLYYSDQLFGLEFSITTFPLNDKGGLAKSGAGLVNTKSCYFGDDSHSGIYKVDSVAVYLPLEQVQVLCGMDTPFKRISSIHIKFAEGVSVSTGTQKVQALWDQHVSRYAGKRGANLLDHVRVQSWQVNRRNIIAPMEKEQVMMSMSFSLLGVITVFIIFVVMYMIISHKSKDIGILKSIGLSVQEILGVFLIFSVLIGLIGSAIGSLGGCVFLAHVNELEDWLYAKYGWQLWDRTMYAIGDIPNQIEPAVIATIILSALAACLIGGLIPSLQAARRKPAEILQVNQL